MGCVCNPLRLFLQDFRSTYTLAFNLPTLSKIAEFSPFSPHSLIPFIFILLSQKTAILPVYCKIKAVLFSCNTTFILGSYSITFFAHHFPSLPYQEVLSSIEETYTHFFITTFTKKMIVFLQTIEYNALFIFSFWYKIGIKSFSKLWNKTKINTQKATKQNLFFA